MPFDPTGAVRFDIARGNVLASDDERHVIVPVDVLGRLVDAAGPHAIAAAHDMGTLVGRRVRESMNGARGVRTASLSDVVDALAGEVSLVGIGALSIERWGRALVVVIENAARIESGFVAALLEAALAEATERRVRCAVIAAEPALRVLVSSASALDRVRAWLESGVTWTEALARLQPPRAP